MGVRIALQMTVVMSFSRIAHRGDGLETCW
jgi:hypothetical protein